MRYFLHVGSGKIRYEGWVNIDIEPTHEPDIVADYLICLRRIEPCFNVESAGLIFSCHFLEHCPWPDGVKKFFDVSHTLLKPGGTLRLVVPDLMKVAKLYVAGDDLKGIYGPDFKVEGIDCAATRFMQFCRAWQHTILFDERLLRMLMEQAGFANIRVMPFGESDVPELCNLDRFASESLAIQGQKP